MRKVFICLLILVLWVQFAYGAAGDVASIGGKAITAIASVDGKANAGIASFLGKPVSDGDAAGPTCTTGADSFTSVATDDSDTGLSTSVRGSSFTATENMNLYSIKVTVTSTGDGAMTCRYGTGADLATYRVTKTVNTSNGTADVEIPFADTANTLGSGTTYYFGCIVDSGTISFKRNASGGYAGGVLTYSTGGWDMNDPVTGYDLTFTVRKCTN